MPKSTAIPERRMGHVRRHRLLSLLVVLVLAVPAGALRVAVPIGVRITAYVGQQPEGPNPQFNWVVARRREQIRLLIQKLRVNTGGASASQIDRAVYPYPVQFDLAGEDDAVKTLTSTAAGTKVIIDAYLQMEGGVRIMMLDKVEVVAAPAAPAQPAAATPKAP